jgi:hypothetical protein
MPIRRHVTRWTDALTQPARQRGLRRAAAQWGGWVALAAGAALCVLGWYGISGERYAERQIPYLASSTIPGAALIVAGAVLIARAENGMAAARIDELYELLVAAPETEGPDPAPGPVAVSSDPPVAVPNGRMYHRPDCPLVGGKPALAADTAVLAPCPVCEPESRHS